MRWLIRICVVLAVLWCAWWWLAATYAERTIDGWLADRRTEGWQAEVSSLDVAGFPLRLGASLKGLALVDPVEGVALSASALDLSVPAYWPGDVTLRLPPDRLRLATPEGEVFVTAQEAQADLRLHPGTALELESLGAVSGPWQVNVPQGDLFAAQDMRADITQDAGNAETYRIVVNAEALTPGDVVRGALLLPGDWPLAFDAFLADLVVRFDAPLDRRTLQDARPQPRLLSIDDVNLQWGVLRLSAAGEVQVAADGAPQGEVAVQLENWRQILEIAQGAGAVDPAMAGQASLFLNALANMGGDPETLDVTLRFDAGQMFLGPIFLRPAPKFILR